MLNVLNRESMFLIGFDACPDCSFPKGLLSSKKVVSRTHALYSKFSEACAKSRLKM